MRSRTLSPLIAAALVLLPAALSAQRRLPPDDRGVSVVPAGSLDDKDDPFSRNRRFEAGASFFYAQPSGAFHDYVRQGVGLDGFFRLNLDSRGLLSLRADGGWLAYGRETQRVPLSGTIGGRILVDLTTSNNIVYASLGPQLTARGGPIRPYINGGVGFAYFFTESSVEGSNNNNEPFASTTNYDDWTLQWKGGGGFLIPLGVRKDVNLDIGAQYHNNGQVKYLRKGSIVDLPNGGIQINPIESQANLITYRIGISVPIR
ncbi:MAG: hypothetical protein U0132_02770 [Gemmatimonadaceae bacterium]